MMKYETGPFKKPNGPLLATPSKRLTPKSSFLRAIERMQKPNMRAMKAEAARIEALRAKMAEAASRAYNAQVEPDNKQRRVTQLRLAYNRKRDK